MRYLHSMVRVRDLEESIAFYRLLGLEETYRSEHEKDRYTLVFMTAPGDMESVYANNAPSLELTYNWDIANYTSGKNFGHLAYEVEDVYELCHRLHAANVIISRPPRDGRWAFIKSPDGITIELTQKGKPLPPQEPWSSANNNGDW